MMENNRLRELAKEFCKTQICADEDDLYNFLVNNEFKIADNYDKACHMEDIVIELTERNYNVDKIPTMILENILYCFEDKLGDYGSESGWRTILNNTIDWYKEDLQEYKLEDLK